MQHFAQAVVHLCIKYAPVHNICASAFRAIPVFDSWHNEANKNTTRTTCDRSGGSIKNVPK